MVRRLVEDQQVRARACSGARPARVRSPGESRPQAATWSARSPNFASRVRTSAATMRHPSRSDRRGRPRTGAGLVDLADGDVGAQARAARRRALATEEQSQQRRLPCPVGAGDTDPLTGIHLQRHRAELNLPCRTTALSSVATTELDRGAPPIVNSSAHSLRGSATSSRRAIRLSIWRTFCACFSLDSAGLAADLVVIGGLPDRVADSLATTPAACGRVPRGPPSARRTLRSLRGRAGERRHALPGSVEAAVVDRGGAGPGRVQGRG